MTARRNSSHIADCVRLSSREDLLPFHLYFLPLCQAVCVVLIIIIFFSPCYLHTFVCAIYFIYVAHFAVHVGRSAPFIYFAFDIYGNRHLLFYRENSRSLTRLMTPSARHKSRRLAICFFEIYGNVKSVVALPVDGDRRSAPMIDKAAVNLVGRFRYNPHNWAQRA